jgi:hypothetical protein
MTMLEHLTNALAEFAKVQKLELGDAEEMLFINLSVEERVWLSRFIELWEATRALGAE